MGETTKIAWCDATVNFWFGCSKVSPGCEHCYAERQGGRAGVAWGPGKPRRHIAGAIPLALRLERRAVRERRRLRVFALSMGDFFDPEVPADWREAAWATIQRCAHLDWLILTKRVENVRGMLPADWGSGWPHVWLGFTAEDQGYFVRRAAVACETPAALWFVSAEPLLGPLDLLASMMPPEDVWDELRAEEDVAGDGPPEELREECEVECDAINFGHDLVLNPEYAEWEARHLECARARTLKRSNIRSIIVGGESGAFARPFGVEWARSLVRQCRDLQLACFVKQMGALPIIADPPRSPDHSTWPEAEWPEGTRFGSKPDTPRELWGRVALLRDPKGGDPEEWPEQFRVRELPAGTATEQEA